MQRLEYQCSQYLKLVNNINLFVLNHTQAEWNNMRREQTSAACSAECQYRDFWSLSCHHQLWLYGILKHQLLSLRFILIDFIITLRFQMLLMLNIQKNQQLFHDISMQIKSLINGILIRIQLSRIQHGLNKLNYLSSSTATRDSTVASRFQVLQKLHRMISTMSVQLAPGQ